MELDHIFVCQADCWLWLDVIINWFRVWIEVGLTPWSMYNCTCSNCLLLVLGSILVTKDELGCPLPLGCPTILRYCGLSTFVYASRISSGGNGLGMSYTYSHFDHAT